MGKALTDLAEAGVAVTAQQEYQPDAHPLR